MFPFSLTSERSSLKILIMGCCCIEDYNQWDTLAEGYTLPQLCSFYLIGLKSTIIKKCAGNLWVGILNIKGKWLIELHKGDQEKPKFCSRCTQVFVRTAKAICRQYEWIIFLPHLQIIFFSDQRGRASPSKPLWAELTIPCCKVQGYSQLWYVLCKHSNYGWRYIQDSTSPLSELILHPVKKRKVAAIPTEPTSPKARRNAEAEQLLPWNAISNI